MTTNKADIIGFATKLASMQGSLFNADPFTDELAGVLLENRMLALENDGILLGWIKDEDPMNPTIDNESGIPDWAVMGVAKILASDLYSAVMGADHPNLAAQAGIAKSSLFSVEVPPIQNNPYMPIGAGQRNPFFYDYFTFQEPSEPITKENDGNLGDLTVN